MSVWLTTGNIYKLEELQIARYMLTKDQQLMKFNLRTNVEPQMVKILHSWKQARCWN